MTGEFLRAAAYAARVWCIGHDAVLICPYKAVVDLYEAHLAAEAREREDGEPETEVDSGR